MEAARSIQQGHGMEYGDGKMATLPTFEGIDPKKAVFQQVRTHVHESIQLPCTIQQLVSFWRAL